VEDLSQQTSGQRVPAIDRGAAPAPAGSVVGLLERVAQDDASLDELDLSDNAIFQVNAATHTRSLAQGLAGNTTLVLLALDGCEIADAEGLILAEALSQNASLTELSVRRNMLRPSTIEVFADSLASNPRSVLRVLELGDQRGGSRIGERVVHAFRRLFETNVTLCRVGGWQLEIQHINQLQPFFSRNSEIERRRLLGKRSDELMPHALKSEAQLLVEQFDPNELIDYMDDEDLEIACEEVGVEHLHDGTEASMRAALREYYSGGTPNFSNAVDGPAPAVVEYVLPPRPESAHISTRNENQGADAAGLLRASPSVASDRVSVYVQLGEPPDVEVVPMDLDDLLQGVLDGVLTEETLVVEADGRAQPLVSEEGWKHLEDCPELLEGPTAAKQLRSPVAPSHDGGGSHDNAHNDHGNTDEMRGAVDGTPSSAQIWLQWPAGVAIPEGVRLEGAEGDDGINTVSVDLEQLLELIMEGYISEETMTYVEGGDDWATLREYGPVLGLEMEDGNDDEEEEDDDDDGDEEGVEAVLNPAAATTIFDAVQTHEESRDEGSDGQHTMFYSINGGEAIPVVSLARLAQLVSAGKIIGFMNLTVGMRLGDPIVGDAT
jgi:hypothetical protein